MSHLPVLSCVAVMTVLCIRSAADFTCVSAAEASGPCDKLGAHEAVFLGTTGAPVERKVLAGPGLKPELLSLQPVVVERAYRGAQSPVMYLYRVASPLPVGRRYLIYADRFATPTNVLTPAIEEPEPSATTDLEFLEALTLTASTGTIHGVVTVGDPYDMEYRRTPLGNVPIRFSSDTFSTEVMTREDGSFVATGLPDGHVRVEPLLPDHLIASPPFRAAQVRAGGCVPHHIVVATNGRVRGRVLRDDGTPYSWLVDLVPLNPARYPRTITVQADPRGEFEFSGQLPGGYLLGVNLQDRSYQPNVRTYYPGTPDREAALPIVLGEGTVRDGLEFRLLPEFPRGEILVRVATRGAADEVGVCVLGTSTGGGVGLGLHPQSAPNAPIVISVLEGRQYRLIAHVERRTGHLESTEILVTGTAGRQELTLVADRTARHHLANDVCGAYAPGADPLQWAR